MLKTDSNLIKLFFQFFKFGIVGVSNTIIMLSVYNVFLLFKIHFIVCNILGFAASVIWAFFINKFWVFKNKDKKQKMNFIKTAIVYTVSFTCGSLLLVVYIDYWGIYDKLAPLINAFLFLPINFFCIKFWTQEKEVSCNCNNFEKAKVIVLGSTGLIGISTVNYFADLNYDVYAFVRNSKPTPFFSKNINIVNFDFSNFDASSSIFHDINADYLINLAWETKDLDSAAQEESREIAYKTFCKFFEAGGKKALIAGTCFEYGDVKAKISDETPLNPLNSYAKNKVQLNEDLKILSEEKNYKYIWARLFYTFGEYEREDRVVPYIIKNLLKGESIVCKNANAVRDYMYVKDISFCLEKLISSEYIGDVNVASGKCIKMKKIFQSIASFMKKKSLVEYTNLPVVPQIMIADTTRIKKLIGRKKFSLKKNFIEMVGFYDKLGAETNEKN